MTNTLTNCVEAAYGGVSSIQQGMSVPTEALDTLNAFKNTLKYIDKGENLEGQFMQMGDHAHNSKILAEVAYKVGLKYPACKLYIYIYTYEVGVDIYIKGYTV